MAKDVFSFNARYDAQDICVGDFVRTCTDQVYEVLSVNDGCGWPSNPDYDCPGNDGACRKVETGIEDRFKADYENVFIRQRLQSV